MINFKKIDKWEYKIYKPIEKLAADVLSNAITEVEFEKEYQIHTANVGALKKSFESCKEEFEKYGEQAVDPFTRWTSAMTLPDVFRTLDRSIRTCGYFELGLKCMESYRIFNKMSELKELTEEQKQFRKNDKDYIKFIANFGISTIWQFIFSFGGRWEWWKRKKK